MSELVLSIVSSIVGSLVLSFFFDIRPYIITTQENIEQILQIEETIQERIDLIEEKYLQKDDMGSMCRVGYSADLQANCVSVFRDNKFGLQSQDVIFITNPYGLYTPTAAFVVSLVDGSDSNSEADLFLSKEGIEKLDISKKDLRKGVFDMRFRRKEEHK